MAASIFPPRCVSHLIPGLGEDWQRGAEGGDGEGKATRESDLLGEDDGDCPRGQVMDNVGTLPYN